MRSREINILDRSTSRFAFPQSAASAERPKALPLPSQSQCWQPSDAACPQAQWFAAGAATGANCRRARRRRPLSLLRVRLREQPAQPCRRRVPQSLSRSGCHKSRRTRREPQSMRPGRAAPHASRLCELAWPCLSRGCGGRASKCALSLCIPTPAAHKICGPTCPVPGCFVFVSFSLALES